MGLSLTEAAKSAPPSPRKSKYCKVGPWLDTLSEDDRVAALAILDPDSGWIHRDVTDVLTANGCVGLAKESVGGHRRGDCSCERR